MILADPATLTGILQAGPATGHSTISYQIPADLLPANPLDVAHWTATVTTDDGTLRELELVAEDPANGSTVTIIVTPARTD